MRNKNFYAIGHTAVLRHIVTSALIGVGIAIAVIKSVPVGVIVATTGLLIAAYEHTRDDMNARLIVVRERRDTH